MSNLSSPVDVEIDKIFTTHVYLGYIKAGNSGMLYHDRKTSVIYNVFEIQARGIMQFVRIILKITKNHQDVFTG